MNKYQEKLKIDWYDENTMEKCTVKLLRATFW